MNAEVSDLATQLKTCYEVNQVLNSETRALLTIIFSGADTKRLMETLLPNHTEISFIALRATINCRFARKNSCGSSCEAMSSRLVSR